MGIKIKGQFVEVSFNGGEYLAVIKADKINKRIITGRCLYTTSAYGDAAVEDYLETGRYLTLKLKDKKHPKAVDIRYRNNPLDEVDLQEGLRKRNALAATFIPVYSENIVQRINIEPKNDGHGTVDFTFLATLPNSCDKDGIPVTTRFWFTIDKKTTLEHIAEIMKRRMNRTSSLGRFIPQTKLYYDDAYIGILANYNTTGVNRKIADKVREITAMLLPA